MKNVLTQSKAIMAAIAIVLFLGVRPASAQTEDDDFSFSLTLVSDQFFGFAPVFSGSYTVSPKVDLSFYGVLWSGGTGGGWGNWTEFGIGANFKVAEGFGINPNLGVTGGNLLSSYTEGPSVFGDGIVPNLILSLDKEHVEGEVYFGYYAPLRDKAPEGGSTAAYIHYWANAGYRVSPKFSFGAHYEHLMGGPTNAADKMPDAYKWIGPYVQFSSPKYSVFSRLSAGGDLVEGNDSFFKVAVGFGF